MQLALESYKNDGLRGLLFNILWFIDAARHTAQNKPIISSGVTIPSTKNLGVLRTAEIIAERYEQEEMALVQEHIPDGSDVVELGGRIGFITALTESTTIDIGVHIVLEMNPNLVPVSCSVKNINYLM